MNENLEEFYKNLLEIDAPWEVNSITRDRKNREVLVTVQLKPNSYFFCPVYGKNVKKYDQKIRRWWHLDSCNHKTLIEGPIFRVKWVEHGVKQILVLWAEERSRFTLEFEYLVLLWLKNDSISTVAKNFGLK